MRIAFVGKGGSGKTTLSALFSLYIQEKGLPLMVVDADINMHLPELLGAQEQFQKEKHISYPAAFRQIQEYLKGDNNRIQEFSHFRKTTPPASGSNILTISEKNNPVFSSFGYNNGPLSLFVVGTYESEDIGASCYHNNLAVFENILSHLDDKEGVLVADMVAGVDAFANTLHAQFDLMVLVVEPTKRGVEVFNQYQSLAQEAGVLDSLFVVGNKIRSDEDLAFIRQSIPEAKLLGILGESAYLRRKEQEGGILEISELEPENRELLKVIFEKLQSSTIDAHERLQKLWKLHRAYVSQGFIKDRFGDLTNQIDETFSF